jgi:hypothetical protein
MATSLLLHFDGANASTTLVDEVGHPFTASGNAQISTAESKFGGTSLLLDGTGDYISTADSADFDFGSSSFTIEAWIRPNLSADRSIISKRDSTSTTGWALEARSTGAVWFRANIGGSWSDTALATTTGILTTNTWAHVALVRNGSSWTLYVDGVSRATLTNSGALSNVATALRLGMSNQAGENYYSGYIDEVRINKGEALYTSAFVVPTQQYFHQNTVLLLRCDGTNGSTTFRDETGKTVTANGNAQISTTQSKYGGASALLDGTGDYLTVGSSSDFDFGTNDFTVEWWAYQSSAKIVSHIDFRGGTSSSPRLMVYNNSSPFTDLRLYVSGADRITAPSGTLIPGQWQHFAICRSAGTTRLFVDGVQVGSSWADSTTYTAATLQIGGNSVTTDRDFNGYIDDLRICRAAKYTAAFTPPAATHDYEYATLLIHADGNNAQTCIRDENGHAITAVGNAQISTAQSKFGGSALLLDGSGDYLNCGDSADYEFGSGDFTMEMWVRLTGYSIGFGGFYAGVLVGKDASGARAFHWKITGTSSSWTNLVFSTAGTEVSVAWTPSLNTWYHVAICKSGTNLRFFVDGVQVGSTQTHSTTIADVSTALTIGGMLFSGFEYQIPAYIDEVRISKGYARYTANFTPPALPFTLLGQYTYTISGTVYDDTGAVASRTIRLYRRDTGALVAETTSTGGTFTFQNPDDREYYLVALDDSSGTQYNALIYDKVVRG